MENNKYDEFYITKSTNELIQQLRFNKINGGSFLNDWHEALINHLKNRVLSNDEKDLFEHILNTDPSQLKIEGNKKADLINTKVDEIIKDEIPIKTTLIAEAGKALKNIVYLILFMIITLFFWVLVAPSFEETNEITVAYTVMGVINVICSLVSLTLLYNAGENLVKSVK